MSNYFMGADLGAEELSLGSQVPRQIPPEGVIIPRMESDGWTRKYLHQMGKNPICIAEIAPVPGTMLSGSRFEPVELPPPQPAVPPAPEPRMSALSVQSPLPMSQPVRVPVPGNNSPFLMGGAVQMRSMEGPVQVRPHLGTPVSNLSGEIAVRHQPLRLAQTVPGMPAAGPAPEPVGRPLSIVLGEAAQPPLEQPPAAPVDPTCGVCPTGPLQLPDGKIVGLDDPVTLKDLCLMMPSILKALQVSCGTPGAAPGAPGQPYPGGPIPVQNPSGGGFPGFGPASSPFGQGGGGGGGGGGLPGPLGVVNQAAPQGAGTPGGPGPVGPQGPPGLGTVVDFISKEDGDFSAGPGAFIPVPGTSFSFTQSVAGAVLFLLNATFGCFQAANNALGIRIDGTTVVPLQISLHGALLATFVFYAPASAVGVAVLPAGTHTVEVMLRGIAVGEFCSGSGLGTAAVLAAAPATPLVLAALHS
jgi:hypothetical protein